MANRSEKRIKREFQQNLYQLHEIDEPSFWQIWHWSENFLEAVKMSKKSSHVFWTCVAFFLIAGSVNSIESVSTQYSEILFYTMMLSIGIGLASGMQWLDARTDRANFAIDIKNELDDKEISYEGIDTKSLTELVLAVKEEMFEQPQNSDSEAMVNGLEDIENQRNYIDDKFSVSYLDGLGVSGRPKRKRNQLNDDG